MQAGGGSSSGGGSTAASTYRGLRARQAAAPIGEINVTPLVDVVLVLLLVFMVTAPMMKPSIDITLPTADLPPIDTKDVRLTIEMNAQGRLHIDGRLVLSEHFDEELKTRVEGASRKVAFIRADESLRYGDVITLVGRVKKAGIEQVGLQYQTPEQKKAASGD